MSRNYNRSLHLVKIFEKLVPHILQFSPDGKLLAVGFTNGHCKLLKSTDLSEVRTAEQLEFGGTPTKIGARNKPQKI